MERINLIFDCDGTILDSYDAIVDWICCGLEHCGVKEDKETIRYLCLHYYVDYCVETLSVKHHINPDDVRNFMDITPENEDLVKPFPNLEKLISNERYNCFVYTHRDGSCRKLLEKFGLDRYFIETVDSTYGFRRKPDKQAIEYLVNRYSMDRNHTYYVGDRLLDIECGINADIKTIFVRTDGLDIDCSKADYVIDDLIEINSLIK